MKVSIIVVSRNARNTIRKCLNSIISQTYPDIEVVVVDSSDDGTEKIIEEYARDLKFPFKIIKQEPKGVGAARNEGLRNATGDIITGVDTDCYIPPDFVEKIVAAFNSDRVMGVQARHVVKSSANSFFSRLVMLYEDIMLKRDRRIYDTADIGILAMRREFCDEVGGFDEDMAVGEDAVYWRRLWKIKKQFERRGFVFPLADTYIIEEKQAQTFREYWKKCMWYGKAFANPKYLFDLKNILRLLSSFYLSLLPISILLAFIVRPDFVLLFITPLLMGLSYMIFLSFSRRIYTWLLMLLPLVLYYKGLFTFLGFLHEMMTKFQKGDRKCSEMLR